MREDRIEDVPKEVVAAMRATLVEAVKLAHTTRPPDPGFRQGLGILAPRIGGYVLEALIDRDSTDSRCYAFVRAAPLRDGSYGWVYQEIDYTAAELNAIDAVYLGALRNDRRLIDEKVGELEARMAARSA